MLTIDQALGDDRTLLLHLQGRLDLTTADQLTAAVEDNLADKPARIVVDFRQCTFVDSSGLGALATALKRAGRVGVPLQVTGVAGQLRLLLDRTNLSRMLPEVCLPDSGDSED